MEKKPDLGAVKQAVAEAAARLAENATTPEEYTALAEVVMAYTSLTSLQIGPC